MSASVSLREVWMELSQPRALVCLGGAARGALAPQVRGGAAAAAAPGAPGCGAGREGPPWPRAALQRSVFSN